MANSKQIIFLLSLVFCHLKTVAEKIDREDTNQRDANSNGSTLIRLEKQKTSIIVYYSWKRESQTIKNQKQTIATTSASKSPFYGIRTVETFGDQLPSVEVTGMCGNKVCEKTLYRFDEQKGRYTKSFQGSYSEAFSFDGHLIFKAPSGCCAIEYRTHRIPKDRKWINPTPEFMITIETDSKEPPTEAECNFMRADGGKISPPNKKWLSFCAEYNLPYSVKK